MLICSHHLKTHKNFLKLTILYKILPISVFIINFFDATQFYSFYFQANVFVLNVYRLVLLFWFYFSEMLVQERLETTRLSKAVRFGDLADG